MTVPGRQECLAFPNFVICAGKSRYIVLTLRFTSHLMKIPNTPAVSILCDEVLLNLH